MSNEGRLHITITGSWPVTPGQGGYSECADLEEARKLEEAMVLHPGEVDLAVLREYITFMEDLEVRIEARG